MQFERKHRTVWPVLLTALLMSIATRPAQANPPLPIGVLTDLGSALVSPADTSTLSALTYSGRGQRHDWIEETGAYALRSAYLFEARYRDAPPLVVEVSSALGDINAASVHASRYAGALGRLPRALRSGIPTIHIQRGNSGFAASSSHFPIYTDYAERLTAIGILDEYLLYNAARATLNPQLLTSPGWLAARSADGEFVSIPARDNSALWDVPESFLAWIGAKYFPGRIGIEKADAIRMAIPNRMAYFDSLDLNMRPLVAAFEMDARVKGMFANPSAPGQGIAVDIDERNHWLEAIWYTTSPGDGAPIWFRVYGDISNGTNSFALIETMSNAQFLTGNLFPQIVGDARIEFVDCNTLTLTYDLRAYQRSGTVTMQRVLSTPDGCADVPLDSP